jgi:hypothetical protein
MNGYVNAVVAPVRHRCITVAVPDHRQSCKEVAGMLQACCKLVGGFLLLAPARSPGRALVPSRHGAASRPAEPGYTV